MVLTSLLGDVCDLLGDGVTVDLLGDGVDLLGDDGELLGDGGVSRSIAGGLIKDDCCTEISGATEIQKYHGFTLQTD